MFMSLVSNSIVFANNLAHLPKYFIYLFRSCCPLEKEMATHSSVLAWRFPGTEEPDGLPSMGLHRVGHD